MFGGQKEPTWKVGRPAKAISRNHKGFDLRAFKLSQNLRTTQKERSQTTALRDEPGKKVGRTTYQVIDDPSEISDIRLFGSEGDVSTFTHPDLVSEFGDANTESFRSAYGHFKFLGAKVNSDGFLTDFKAAEVHFNRVASLGLASRPPLSYVSGAIHGAVDGVGVFRKYLGPASYLYTIPRDVLVDFSESVYPLRTYYAY